MELHEDESNREIQIKEWEALPIAIRLDMLLEHHKDKDSGFEQDTNFDAMLTCKVAISTLESQDKAIAELQAEVGALRSGIPPTDRDQDKLLKRLNAYANRRMSKRSEPQALATSALMEIIYRGFDIAELVEGLELSRKTIFKACNSAVDKLNEFAPNEGWDSGDTVAAMHCIGLDLLLAKHRPGDNPLD